MAIEITMNKPKTGAKRAKGHKGIRSAHNKQTGKYVRQVERTAANKKRNIALNKSQGDVMAGKPIPKGLYLPKSSR
ncbi:MAG: hypothetical protein A2W17_12535 [Planctomycetes bacterium RBG_16_41_13]|nr:MAG: hypothetical protein A2W17_12535 [Planctomycetes bacterium RBG_16_41_13]